MTRLERLMCELSIRRQEYEFIKQDGLKWYRTAQYKDYNKTRYQLKSAVSILSKQVTRLGGANGTS